MLVASPLKNKVSVTSLGRPIRPALISGFGSMKRLGVFLLPPGWYATVHRGVTPSISPVPIYTHGWREALCMSVKCLAQEHNTMSPARTRTRTTRSGVEHSNHDHCFLNYNRVKRLWARFVPAITSVLGTQFVPNPPSV